MSSIHRRRNICVASKCLDQEANTKLHQKLKFSKSRFYQSLNASVDLKANLEKSVHEKKAETSVDLKAKLERPSFIAKK